MWITGLNGCEAMKPTTTPWCSVECSMEHVQPSHTSTSPQPSPETTWRGPHTPLTMTLCTRSSGTEMPSRRSSSGPKLLSKLPEFVPNTGINDDLFILLYLLNVLFNLDSSRWLEREWIRLSITRGWLRCAIKCLRSIKLCLKGTPTTLKLLLLLSTPLAMHPTSWRALMAALS